MYAISIGTETCLEPLRERLSAEIRSLREEGLDIQVEEESRGHLTFFDCNLPDAPAAGEDGKGLDVLLRHTVAGALSDVIIDNWEQRLLHKLIHASYYYFNKEEQDTILNYAGRNLNSGEGDRSAEQTVSRKRAILHRVLEYLDSGRELVLEGFVTFRLKDYVEELEDAVDRAVDDFLMEKEYTEFIRLLRYFVEAQEPRIDEVHVVVFPGGGFKLQDSTGQTIHNEYLEEFVVEMVDSAVNYEDLLISSLITIAPARVRLHVPELTGRDEAVETVRSVFGERVTLCRGCDTCLQGEVGGTDLSRHVDLRNWQTT